MSSRSIGWLSSVPPLFKERNANAENDMARMLYIKGDDRSGMRCWLAVELTIISTIMAHTKAKAA